MIHTTFLTVDYLKEITSVSQSVDVNTLAPFIPIGEELWINDVLGTALKDSLITMIENGTLSGVSETLVEDYIIPASAWSCYFEASPFLMYRTENRGITKKFSENSQPLDKAEFTLFRQSINDKMSFYRNRLIQYLEDNKTTFTLWRCTDSNRINKDKDFSGGIYV